MKINDIINQLEEIYSGKPWYGDSVSDILKNISADDAIKKPSPDGHTVVDLVYHMITWRYFVIKQLRGDKEYDVKQNDTGDWREINYSDKNLWADALFEFEKIHNMLIFELNNFKGDLLDNPAPLRNYSYGFMLAGVIQHDLYHLGQISLIKSMLKKKTYGN